MPDQAVFQVLNTAELPRQLVALLNFEPVLEPIKNTRQAKLTESNAKSPSKKRARFTKESFPDEIPATAARLLPSLNEVIDKQRQGYSGRKLIREQVERGRIVGSKYLEERGLTAPLLPWAAVHATVYFPDYRQHDVQNLYLKGVIDGLSEWIKTGRYAKDKRAGAGYWPDDQRIIEFKIAAGGVDQSNPRVELAIYRLELTLEQEARLLASSRDRLARQSRVRRT
jgi:hypothetical protein